MVTRVPAAGCSHVRPYWSSEQSPIPSAHPTSVLIHYRQAVGGFTNRKYESASSDLRAAFEDLVTRLAGDCTGHQRQRQASQGGLAISHMTQNGHLPEGDGGLLLRGLWQLPYPADRIRTPGQSDADGNRFRMQVITATARFLFKQFRERT